jgi:hypothetical protein
MTNLWDDPNRIRAAPILRKLEPYDPANIVTDGPLCSPKCGYINDPLEAYSYASCSIGGDDGLISLKKIKWDHNIWKFRHARHDLCHYCATGVGGNNNAKSQ